MNIHNRIHITQKSMEVTQGMKFQWIKGDNFGDVEIVTAVTTTKATFEGGRKLMLSAFDEFMKPIKSDNDVVVVQTAGVTQQLDNMIGITESVSNVGVVKPDTDFSISKKKVEEAISSSKKSKMLNIKLKVKYLDPSLYTFLNSTDENFDSAYKEMLIDQAKEELNTQLENFLSTIYTND